MRKKFLPVWAVCICLLLLTGCGCRHEWEDANCENPKTCLKCGETEGEKNGHTWIKPTCTRPRTCIACGKTIGYVEGHDWQEVTCTTPKTCLKCGETEGQALGHTFTDWVLEDGIVFRTCDTCSEMEKSDTGTYMSAQLVGHWQLVQIKEGSKKPYVPNAFLRRAYYLDWAEDGQAVFCNFRDEVTGRFQYREFEAPNRYWFDFIQEDGTVLSFFYLDSDNDGGLYYGSSEDQSYMIFRKTDTE